MSDETGSIRVLHVDDEPSITELTTTYLERADDRFDVRTTTRADAALEILRNGTVDCVVSDYDMPEMNGIELLRTIREKRPDLPYILYTGKGSEEIASDAISAGVTDYLQKGTSSEQYTVLANRITNAVESYRSQRTLAERKRKLRKFERIVNTMAEAACIYDRDGRFEIVNEYLADWYNTTPEALEGTSSNLLPRIADAKNVDPLRALLEEDRSQLTGEIEGTFPNHGYAILEYRLTPLRIDGSIEGIVGIVRDVTESRTKTQRLETLIQNLPGVVYQSKMVPEYPMEFVRGECESLTGYAPSALESGSVFWGTDVVHPDDQDRLWEAIRNGIEADDQFEVTYRIRTAADTTKWVWERGRLVSPQREDETVFEGFITDITARKEREQILKTLHDVGLRHDESQSVAEISEQTITAAENALEFDLSVVALEWEGKLEVEATSESVPPDGATTMSVETGIAGETYRTGESVLFDDLRDNETAEPQGEYRSGISIPIGDHGVFQAVSREPYSFDESDLELAELLVDQTTSALDRLEYERTLERQNERLQEFTNVISHDLRNPLTVAQTRLELAEDDCDTPHHEPITRAHERMETLIEDLLALARQSDPVVDPSEVALDTVAEQCWLTVQTESATLCPDTSRTIRADENRVKQLFENFFRNSVEHGGSDVTIRIGELPDGFFVEDDGPGIPESDRADVFETGFSTASAGTGFGLRIVEQIVEAHDWEIRVTDGEEGGARFEITGVESAE